MRGAIREPVTGGQQQNYQLLEYLEHRPDVEVVYLAPTLKWVRNSFVLTNLWYILRLQRLRGRAIIVLEDYSRRLSLFAANWVSSSLTHARLICTINAVYFSYRTSRLTNWIDRLISIVFLRRASMIVVASPAVTAELKEFYHPTCPVQVVSPALRPEFAVAKPRTNRPRHTAFHLLHVGRLHPIKGVEYLIEALSLLRHRRVRLTVVGDTLNHPPYGRRVMSLVETLGLEAHIEFVGLVRDVCKLIRLYEQADLLVLPSLWESNPIVLAEAMCLGVPSVASRVGGIPEIVEDGVTGLLVAPGDPQSLAEAIESLMEDAQLLASLRMNALSRADGFRQRTWQDASEEYYRLFEACLTGESL
jgi:glycosyltransferase involved in cell wall biosynthesis